MPSKQMTLPDFPPKFNVRRAHVIDAGVSPCDNPIFLFRCERCAWQSEWTMTTRTEARKGLICPNCNKKLH